MSATSRARLVSPADWVPIEIDDLEEAAWAAMRHVGSSSVAAGPGSGKTEFLAQRAAYLLETGLCPAPQKILAISYKRESAANLRRRVSARLPDRAQYFHSLTFDAFAKGIVDKFHRLLPKPWQLRRADYDVELLNKGLVQGRLQKVRSNPPSGQSPEHLRNWDAGRFLPDVIGSWPLPFDPNSPPHDRDEYAAWSWWKFSYIDADPQQIDFTMVNRLAELIVRSSPQLQRALRATYPFVFVDEFQDTTEAQLSFLKTVFGGPRVTVTAVGDRKQRIMQFAGALESAMERFESEFQAQPFQLLNNYRSSDQLVEAQHHVASHLDPSVPKAVSKALVEDGHTALSLWTFENEAAQARAIAQWIHNDIASSGRSASDFAIIARQLIAKLHPALATAFEDVGIKLRNDDTRYGDVTLQDLLKSDLVRLLLAVLQITVHHRGQPQAWEDAMDLISRVRGADFDAASQLAASEHLSAFVAKLRRWLTAHPVETAEPREVLAELLAVADGGDLAGFVRGEQAGEKLNNLVEAFGLRLQQVMRQSADWSSVLSDFSAQDAVSLMTFHRSKGLEYHTVFAIGLDDEQWWSYLGNPAEGVSTFFVGLSRAGQRVVFTTTSDARDGKIKELYGLLKTAGAVEEKFEDELTEERGAS